MYEKQVKSILQAAFDRHGFIDWSAVRNVSMAVQQLLDTAQKQIEIKNIQSAFFISTAVMEQMTEALQYADDSNGDFGGSIDGGFRFMA